MCCNINIEHHKVIAHFNRKWYKNTLYNLKLIWLSNDTHFISLYEDNIDITYTISCLIFFQVIHLLKPFSFFTVVIALCMVKQKLCNSEFYISHLGLFFPDSDNLSRERGSAFRHGTHWDKGFNCFNNGK